MILKEGDILYDGTTVFQVTAYIAEPQVTIKPMGSSGNVVTYPLSKLPKNMVKLVPETDRIRKRRVNRVPKRPQADKLIFRGNSKMQRAYPFIKQVGKALTVAEILAGIGEPITPSSRVIMASDLYRFAKKGKGIKTVGRGLFAYEDSLPVSESTNQEVLQLPDNFGKD